MGSGQRGGDEPVSHIISTRRLLYFATDLVDVARCASTVFGFGPKARFSRFPLTENATFAIREEGVPDAVLRVYRAQGRPRIEIESEITWQRALGEEIGSMVSPILVGQDGSTLVEVEQSKDGTVFFCVAYPLISGREPGEDKLQRWFPELGAITALLHRQARTWVRPAWFTRPTWNVDTTLGDHPHWGHWSASVHDSEERAMHQRISDVVAARLHRFGMESSRFGLVHADLRLANVLVEGESITVLDFDDCGFSWYLYDLACALTFNEARADAGDLVAAWVAAYRQVEPISSVDEYEIPTFIMLRRLLMSAYVGLRSDIDLAHELAENRFSSTTCDLGEAYLGTRAV